MASLPCLEEGEIALLALAADDPRDVMSFADKEALILQLYNQTQEQELEKAILEQEPEQFSGENVEEQLAIAERELLEARATYTVRKKAITTTLMADPTLKTVYLRATSPAERSLLRLINRRDVLSLVHENLASAHSSTLKTLSDRETENLAINEKNKKLVRELLGLVDRDPSWKEDIDDEVLRAQLSELEAEYKKRKAKWETMKSIASAVIVASGVDWAEDDTLRALVLDDSDD